MSDFSGGFVLGVVSCLVLGATLMAVLVREALRDDPYLDEGD